MKNFLILSMFLVIASACAPSSADTDSVTPVSAELPATATTPESVTSDRPYPGVAIDEVFPVIFQRAFMDGDEAKGRLMIPVLEYSVEVDHFRPRAVWRGNKKLLTFRTQSAEGYWSVLVGVSHLRGPDSTEIYIVNTGPGGVCCTNYWIIDVSSQQPLEMFKSERFGRFRGPMEIFDDEGDGVYELVQFDSCFRYFMGDCGSCSPEPRVAFSFDKRSGKYLPAKGLVQDFAKTGLEEQERKLEERFRSLETANDLRLKLDLESSALDHFVQRLHLGDEQGAWRVFKKYIPEPSKEMLAEIRWRLRDCPFYQAIHQASVEGR